jgi:hypothetical protein
LWCHISRRFVRAGAVSFNEQVAHDTIDVPERRAQAAFALASGPNARRSLGTKAKSAITSPFLAAQPSPQRLCRTLTRRQVLAWVNFFDGRNNVAFGVARHSLSRNALRGRRKLRQPAILKVRTVTEETAHFACRSRRRHTGPKPEPGRHTGIRRDGRGLRQVPCFTDLLLDVDHPHQSQVRWDQRLDRSSPRWALEMT